MRITSEKPSDRNRIAARGGPATPAASSEIGGAVVPVKPAAMPTSNIAVAENSNAVSEKPAA